MSDNLAARSFRALSWDLLGSIGQQGVNFIISLFLARLLAPEAFGIVGMALVFISLFQVFADFGLASALIQCEQPTTLMYSSVFWLNLGVGILLCLVFQVVAPFIGKFYENDAVTLLIRYLAFGFIISALQGVQAIILTRNLDFKALSIRHLIAAAVSGFLGVGMAFQGYGVYALVVQQLSAGFIGALLLWWASKWLPRWEFSWQAIRTLMSFSAYIFFSQFLNVLLTRLDVLLIGKLFSPSTLGYYSRAESLNHLVVRYSSNSISKVFFPVLSRIQNQPNEFRILFLKILEAVAFIVFMLSGLLFITGEFLILLLFGEKWQPSVIIFQILILKVFNYPINSVLISSFLALGKARENFWYGLVRKLFQLIPLSVAYFYGFEAFLYALVVISYVATVFNSSITSYANKIPFIKQLMTIYSFAIFFGMGLILTYYVFDNIQISSDFIKVIGQSILFVLIYLSFIYYFKRNFLIKNANKIFNKFSKTANQEITTL